jgi:hypothetical protein
VDSKEGKVNTQELVRQTRGGNPLTVESEQDSDGNVIFSRVIFYENGRWFQETPTRGKEQIHRRVAVDLIRAFASRTKQFARQQGKE